MEKRKLGYYHYSPRSNRRLIEMFEKNQKVLYSKTIKEWNKKEAGPERIQLIIEERRTRKEILKMLKRGEIQTPDDFYRAGHFFHHGSNFRDYALGLALFAASRHLGELWGKNAYAVALDRFLISIKQPQYFVTQFEKRRRKWIISPYRKNVSDKERKEYFVEPLKKTKKTVGKMNKDES